MLLCTFIAGSLFLSEGSTGRHHNFHHASYLHNERGHLKAYFGDWTERFTLPDHLKGQSVETIINDCIADADYRVNLKGPGTEGVEK